MKKPNQIENKKWELAMLASTQETALNPYW
jgi:hypothetical protein